MKPLRRKDRGLNPQQAQELLAQGEYGILSSVGADGQPYGVPLSYAYHHPAIYFHCAMEGHKIENLLSNPRAAFCVVGKTRVLAETFATEYESAIAFGVASEVQGTERRDALVWLLEKYSPQHVAAGREYIDRMDHLTRVFKIEIEGISGKARSA